MIYPSVSSRTGDPQDDLSEQRYGDGSTAGGSAPTVAIYVDRPHVRQQVREDAVMTGYRVVASGSFEDFARASRASRAGVVLIDCPAPGAAGLAALARQDAVSSASRAQLIVATTFAGIEDVFGCLDQSRAQLLVDASPADLGLALARALALADQGGVRELADDDRRQLLHLAEQISRLAARLDRYGAGREGGDPDEAPGDRLAAPALPFRGAGGDESGMLRVSLPPPALLRRIIRQRQQRSIYFGDDLFGDPAWDMLLDLTAARGEGKRVSVTSLCIASGVPATTALRWIGQMTHLGLLQRVEDSTDRRRAFIDLTDRATDTVARYFAALGKAAGTLI